MTANISTGGRVDVPLFDNAISSYPEFRERAMLFEACMQVEGKEKQSALMLLGQLTGLVWEESDSLAEDTDKLEEADAFDKLIAIFHSRFKRDKSTELPNSCEDGF